MTSTKPRRIGQKMRWAAEYVKAHPGCTKLAVAERVGPNGSRQYGYAIVDRAIGAGLIEDRSEPGSSRYALHVVGE